MENEIIKELFRTETPRTYRESSVKHKVKRLKMHFVFSRQKMVVVARSKVQWKCKGCGVTDVGPRAKFSYFKRGCDYHSYCAECMSGLQDSSCDCGIFGTFHEFPYRLLVVSKIGLPEELAAQVLKYLITI